MNVSSMLQIPCKVLSTPYILPRRHISLLQLSPLLFVRGEEKKDKERRHEEKARPSRRLFWLSLVAYGVIR